MTKKSDLSMLIWAFQNNPYSFMSPKQKIWFWRLKSISPYENFPNGPTERRNMTLS